MKKYLILLALLATTVSCEILNPDPVKGSFCATFTVSGDKDAPESQISWTVGDKVVLSNCTEDIVFKDGQMVASTNAECFTVTAGMMSKDAMTIGFESAIPSSKNYAILTARDFENVACLKADGTVELRSMDARTELDYVASAVSPDGKFSLAGVNNIFSLDIVDRRVRYIDVSVGYSDFEIEVDRTPVTYYFPLDPDEDISDGVYAYAYDLSCEKIFSEHFTDISFSGNCVRELGAFIDFGDNDASIIREIIASEEAVEETYCLEGELLKKYMDEVVYDDDYSYTKIKNYVKSDFIESKSVRPAYISVKDLKSPKKVYIVSDDYEIQTRKVTSYDKQAVYNLIPGRTYKYGIVSTSNGKETLLKKGCFATEGQVRVIKTTYMHNVRDVGGWEALDGRHIRYGVLFRGGEILDSDENLSKYEQVDYEALVNQAGIDFDMDFRTDEGAAYFNKSPFGLEFIRIPLSAYESIVSKKDRWPAFKKAIVKFIKNTKEGKCTYVHCQGGADRTGTFIFYIEGLLGVSDSDLCKDYEITSFYYHKQRNDPERYLPMIKALRQRYGNDCTIGEAIYQSALDMGLTRQDIEDLRSLMLE